MHRLHPLVAANSEEQEACEQIMDGVRRIFVLFFSGSPPRLPLFPSKAPGALPPAARAPPDSRGGVRSYPISATLYWFLAPMEVPAAPLQKNSDVLLSRGEVRFAIRDFILVSCPDSGARPPAPFKQTTQ